MPDKIAESVVLDEVVESLVLDKLVESKEGLLVMTVVVVKLAIVVEESTDRVDMALRDNDSLEVDTSESDVVGMALWSDAEKLRVYVAMDVVVLEGNTVVPVGTRENQ